MSNEGKACDAIIRLLERRTEQKRSAIRRPEIDASGPPIDLHLNVGGAPYAIEHTEIEAFEGQIRTGKEFGQLVESVAAELDGNLPGPAIYHLYFPIDSGIRASPNDLEDARVRLKNWICEQAQILHNEHPERPTRDRDPRGFEGEYRGTPPRFPYEVLLVRESHWSLSSQLDGSLLVSRIAPENVEILRNDRLKRALAQKCPKLDRYKLEGSRTVLILESRDISLSNHVVIGDSLALLMQRRTDVPDEVYLVSTSLHRWAVWLLSLDGKPIETPEWQWFDMDELDDVTSTLA